MTRITVLFLTLVAILGLLAACGDSKADIADEVAREWVDASIDLAANAAAELVIDESPALAQLAGAALAGQIREHLNWSYSTPRKLSEDRYSVIATAEGDLQIDLPLLGDKAYRVSAPFYLDIDTEARTVSNWSIDPLQARVEEQ